MNFTTPRSWRLRGLPTMVVLLLLCLPSIGGAAPEDSGAATALWGFTPENAAKERILENEFDQAVNLGNLRSWMERMAARPNHVGSVHDADNARFILGLYRSWGWQAHIETFQVLFPVPLRRELTLLGPRPYRASLSEPPIAGDVSSALQDGALPPYNAYSADGDVTGPLVYVNYGLPEDYAELERRGISVAGRIVIARYGESWRGIKPKLAQQHGAIGCVIYSDPAEDGYARGDPYPIGPARPEFGVQRGSVSDIPVYSGDPLTPGFGATENAPRLSRDQAAVLLKIPVLPISYHDALPLLENLRGGAVPPKWRGALGITYHFGPSAAAVHLLVQSNWSLQPVHDVIAVLPGSEYPDEWVVRGNHFDGWVFGASDPLSGQVALLEEARGIGLLAQAGWRPKRTIVYASWDGEEPGLLGSTEWAETHADELRQKMVLYVNSDNVQRGFLRMGGSQSLKHFLNQVAADVLDPETHTTVGERQRARHELNQSETAIQAETPPVAGSAQREVPIEALGSGSDYTPFLQHLGIASVDLEYRGEGGAQGVYHSAYDTYSYYERFADPKFEYVGLLARTSARAVLRYADADVLPVRAADLARSVGIYLGELKSTLKRMVERTATQSRLAAENDYFLTSDPENPVAAPRPEEAPPPFDFAPLDEAERRLRQSAEAYDAMIVRSTSGVQVVATPQWRAANAVLLGLEQTLLTQEGLPGRAWYQHLLYAPGLYTGYGVKTLPGVREALENRDWATAERYRDWTAAALVRYANQLDAAAAALRRD